MIYPLLTTTIYRELHAYIIFKSLPLCKKCKVYEAAMYHIARITISFAGNLILLRLCAFILQVKTDKLYRFSKHKYITPFLFK